MVVPRFSYTAVDTDGVKKRGTLTASSQTHALDQLASQGLAPTKVALGGSGLNWWEYEVPFLSDPAISRRDLILFFENLSSMLQAKVPLVRALTHSVEAMPDKRLRLQLQEAVEIVTDGGQFSTGLAALQKPFPADLLALVQIGETTNNLESVTLQISNQLKSEEALRSEVRQALAYPVILLAMSVLVIGLLVFYLAPTLAPVFVTSGAELPPLLTAMLAIRDTIMGQPELWTALICGVVAAGWFSRDRIKRAALKLTNSIPSIADYRRKRETLAFCQALNLMLASGGQITDGLRIFSEATDSEHWRFSVANAMDEIKAGKTLSATLLEDTILVPFAASVLRTGEESNTLATVLPSLVETLRQQTRSRLGATVKLITPVVTLGLGILVGAIIVTTIGAILDLNDVVF